GLGHLVIHVHQNRCVKRCAGQPRIVRLTEGELNVGQLEALRPPRELDQVVFDDILRDHLATGTEEMRQPDRVVAAARTNVPDRRPGFEPKKLGDLPRLIECVAFLLARATRTHDVRHGALRSRKSLGWFARWREIGDLLRPQGERVERDHHNRHRDDGCEHGARGLHGHVAFPLSEAAAYQEGYALTAATLTSTRYWRCSRKFAMRRAH